MTRSRKDSRGNRIPAELDLERTQSSKIIRMKIPPAKNEPLSIAEASARSGLSPDTLRYYDNQVGYSTVDLTVSEVREYTPEPTITLTYWERMSKGFRESVHNTAEFFKELFLWFVTSLPWLIPLCAFIALLVALLRRRAARSPEIAARRAARKEARALRRVARKARKTGGNADKESEK